MPPHGRRTSLQQRTLVNTLVNDPALLTARIYYKQSQGAAAVAPRPTFYGASDLVIRRRGIHRKHAVISDDYRIQIGVRERVVPIALVHVQPCDSTLPHD